MRRNRLQISMIATARASPAQNEVAKLKSLWSPPVIGRDASEPKPIKTRAHTVQVSRIAEATTKSILVASGKRRFRTRRILTLAQTLPVKDSRRQRRVYP